MRAFDHDLAKIVNRAGVKFHEKLCFPCIGVNFGAAVPDSSGGVIRSVTIGTTLDALRSVAGVVVSDSFADAATQVP